MSGILPPGALDMQNLAMVTTPTTVPTMAQPDWGQPQFVSHTWLEPIIVVGIMIASCYFNRRPGYPIRPVNQGQGLLDQGKPEPSDEQDLASPYDEQDPFSSIASLSTERLSKERQCCGTVLQMPNSSRYANHWHSRFLQKFPFLIEMFYWALNYVSYVSAKALGEQLFSTAGIWETAEKHGIAVLAIEHDSLFSFLFPVEEAAVQQFFMNHQDMLTFLNRTYSLVHIPATVSFLGWYYYAAPTHSQFATVRRMMTLTNLFSFIIFTAIPCMPPRLLPKEYGFFDTVRRDDAQSVWATGKFFNQLAAFPSLHFGYAFCVGTTLLYHSGVFRRRLARREKRMSKHWQAIFVVLGVLYPAFVLTIIVSTANHYYLDALAASFVVGFAWRCNHVLLVLLPLEDLLLWCTKLEKPVPTTGTRRR